jgi:uncharacterized repeat protein (TIGR01451 family)
MNKFQPRLRHRKRLPVLGGLTILLLTAQANLSVLANTTAAPVVNTTISLAKTGSEPFDSATWDPVNVTDAGLDASEDNTTVRMQDSITYKVEVSVNDAAVDNLTATVEVDALQGWIAIPGGCITDPEEVTEVSNISADKRTLFCNLGSAVEGTARTIYPVARALGVSADGNQIARNDDHVSASVSAQASGPTGTSNTATDGPTDVTVTAGFKVDTIKELQVTATDPDTGEPLYSAPAKKGVDGTTDGSVIEYVIKVRYLKGSMIADAPDEANGDYEIDFSLLDHYTDDNPHNNLLGLSTGAVLYDWDPAKPACELVGDHGPNAAVSCAQVNYALDQLSENLGSSDGVNDPNIAINLQNIDVRDPDNDANLVEMKINIWYSEPADIATTDDCPPTPCQINTINSVGVYDPTGGPGSTPTVTGFNPVSTEDANYNNLPNFNGAGEPFPDYVSYPLIYTQPGSWTPRKSFYGVNSEAAVTGKPTLTRSYAAGDTIPFLLNTFDRRNTDGAQAQVCDKIDTNNFEYAGLAAPNRTDMGYTWNQTQYNPTLIFHEPGVSSSYHDGSDFISFLYSDEPNLTLAEQRDDICDDDVNGDTFYVIDGIDQATGLATAQPNDWVTDPALLSGGMSSVAKVRMETTIDKAYVDAHDPSNSYLGFTSNHLLKIKLDATGYPNPDGNTYLANFSTGRIHPGDGNWTNWADNATGSYAVSIDPNNAGFGYEFYYADRVILVPSSISVAKRTEPRGIKVVRGGDVVDFIIEPQVSGGWAPTLTTATVTDPLPSGTDYIPGSERFSVDGGTSWLSYDEYQAASTGITLTSAANSNVRSLTWNFDSVETGEQLPLIRYSVAVGTNLVRGTFVNTATLTSPIGVDEKGGPDPDGDGPLTTSPDGTADPQQAAYQLTILPNSGVSVAKEVIRPVYAVNKPFYFELYYQNLGGEDYSGGEFIDILPYNDDGTGQNSSGLSSTRVPNSRFSGTYTLTKVDAPNGEVVYATTHAPADIPQDPCHEANQPAGTTPAPGSLCEGMYQNNGGSYAGGAASGSAAVTWTACTQLDPLVCDTLDPQAITAIRFTTPALAAADGSERVRVYLMPQGNVGGTPELDTLGKVTAASTGDIYTNTFGGRVNELSLQVISNDVSVTMVSGSMGDYVWLDENGDGIQDGDEAPLPGVTVQLLDGEYDPVYRDPATGGIVDATTPGAVPYTVQTDDQGHYLFENLTTRTYRVRIDTSTLPAGLTQTYDFDDELNHTSSEYLETEYDAVGQITGVEDNADQDFGYRTLQVDIDLSKSADKSGAKRGETVIYTLTVTNSGQDNATNIVVNDKLPAGVTLTAHNAQQGSYDPASGDWTVGDLAAGGGSATLQLTVTVD